MLYKTTIYIILSCCIFLSLLSCNSGQQKEKKIHEHYSQTEGNIDNTTGIDLVAFEKLLEKDSLNIELRMTIAANYYSIKEYNKAVDHFLIVNEIDKKNLPALISLGNLYYDTQQNDKAIEFYERALELDHENLNVRCDMATCY